MMLGYKQTQGKLDLSELPLKALIEVAQVLNYGSEKYSRGNWLKGLKLSDLRGAQKRHEAKFDLGDQLDEESGLYHLAHKACLSLMELELYITNHLFDDDGKALYWKEIDFAPDYRLSKRYNPPHNVLPEA